MALSEVKTARQLVTSAEREASSARREANEVQGALDDATERVAALEQASGMLSQTDTERTAVVEELNRANTTLSNELEDARSQSTSANEQVLALTRDLGAVQAKLQDVTEEVAQLKVERDTLTVEKGAAVRRCEATERDLEAHKNEVKRRSHQREREVNDLRNKVDELTQSEASLKAELVQAESMPTIQGQSADGRMRVELNEARTEIRKISRESDEWKQQATVGLRKLKDTETALNLARSEAERHQRAATATKQQASDAVRGMEELKTAVASRDKAAVQSQAGFSSTLASIRNEHERERGVYEDRIRKTQAQCKQLQAQITTVEVQQTEEAESKIKLQREVKARKAEVLAAQNAEVVAKDHLNLVKAQQDQRIDELSVQLSQANGSLATLKAQRDQVQVDLESKEDELERVVREYKENVPRAAAVEAAQEQANKALDLLEKTTASKNMLLAKLDGTSVHNRDLQAQLDRVFSSDVSVKERLHQSKRVLREAEQQKQSYLGLWNSELGQSAALKQDYAVLRGSVANLQQHDATLAAELDELGAENSDLQHTLAGTLKAQSLLDQRLSSYEDKAARDMAELRMSARTDRGMIGQFQASAADLSRTHAARLSDERAQNTTLQKSMKNMEQDHKKLMDAYVAEVGDQRREIDRLRQREAGMSTSSSSFRR
jgi:chromosome segregation ATPase